MANTEKNVQVRVDVPPEVHKRFKVHCIEAGTNMSAWLLAQIKKAVSRKVAT